MKCPNCGRDVPDGHMYCDECGQEFQIVPEFEPEIETQIDTILSGIGSKIDSGFSNNKQVDRTGTPDKSVNVSGDTREMIKPGNVHRSSAEKPPLHRQPDRMRERKPAEGRAGTGRKRSGSAGKKRILISIPILVIFVIILIVTISVAHKTGADYIRMAVKSYEKGDRLTALEYLLKAEEEEPRSGEAYLLRATYLREGGDTDAAIAELVQITNSAAFSEEDLKAAYAELADIYNESAAYEELQALMSRCPFSDLQERYVQELLPAPVFTPGEGEYEGKAEISISLPEGATAVYYTLDGSEPDATKTLYTAPVLIEEEGKLTVKAAAVSAKGLRGEVVSAEYTIKPVKVKEPQILQASGNYTKATRIVALADPGLKIHYTTKEKEIPDEDSPEYTEPIAMPTGETFFNFVCIDEEGNVSEVVTRQYILAIERRITENNAIAYVQQALQSKGYLYPGLTFQVEGTVDFGNEGEFYFLREYKDGNATGLLYAVHTQNGTTKRVGYDSGGHMILMAF